MSHGNADKPQHRILILGGTGEARRLAGALEALGHSIISSLAGRTRAPLLPSGAVRIGGFGGAAGLARYLAEEKIDRLIDATHPFAARISANAVLASARTQTPLIRLDRPVWQQPEGAVWLEVPDMAAAALALPADARALLTIGRQEIGAFFSRTDCRFTARMIEIADDIPRDWTVLSGIGTYTVDAEIGLLETHRITHLVSKNSGGPGGAKLAAAARLGIETLIVSRPALPPAPVAASVEAVIEMMTGTG